MLSDGIFLGQCMFYLLTLTFTLALATPSCAMAQMVQVPFCLKVTLPAAETLATFAFDENQRTLVLSRLVP